MPVYLFGYGSLAGSAAPERQVSVTGFRREWNVAMDNRVDLPGYKYYLDPVTEQRPDCHVVFLNLERSPAARVNGVLLETSPEHLAAIDARERNYERVAVTDHVDPPVLGEVHAYVGTEAGRRRWEAGMAAGTCVVDEHYLRAVRDAFAGLGEAALRHFCQSTAAPRCPVRPLLRRDLSRWGPTT